METTDLSKIAFTELLNRGQHVSFAESLTGGLIAATLIRHSGSSAVINESYVTYAETSKVRILGVAQETVDTVGVVSERCAREMSEGVRKISSADWGVSATGVAGPTGGTSDTPVGTVFLGAAGPQRTLVRKYCFSGSRDDVRLQSVQAAFALLLEAMNEPE